MATNAPPLGATITYSRQFGRCRKPGCSTCAMGAGHGPYWFAYWREDGRLRSRYLGKQHPGTARLTAAASGKSTAAAPPVLHVRTLGGFTAWRGTLPIPATSWRRRLVATLFKQLLQAPGNRLQRVQLVELLWDAPDL